MVDHVDDPVRVQRRSPDAVRPRDPSRCSRIRRRTSARSPAADAVPAERTRAGRRTSRHRDSVSRPGGVEFVHNPGRSVVVGALADHVGPLERRRRAKAYIRSNSTSDTSTICRQIASVSGSPDCNSTTRGPGHCQQRCRRHRNASGPAGRAAAIPRYQGIPPRDPSNEHLLDHHPELRAPVADMVLPDHLVPDVTRVRCTTRRRSPSTGDARRASAWPRWAASSRRRPARLAA